MWPFDENNRATYQQYAQGYDTGNYGGIDQNQTAGYIQQFLQGAPADMQQRVYQQHFEQMPYEQRAFLAQQVPPQYGMDPNNPMAMSQGMFRLGQEQPGMVQRLFSHPVLLGGSVVLAGLIAKHMLDHHERGREREPQYGYNQGNQGYQDSYQNQGYGQERELRSELNQERREEKELRRELREDEREEERGERRHRREEW